MFHNALGTGCENQPEFKKRLFFSTDFSQEGGILLQHSKNKRWNLKHKITASVLALTVVGSGAVPLISTVANAASTDDTVGDSMSVNVGTSNGTDVFWTPATYFDYLSDAEIKNGWRNTVKAGTGFQGSEDEWYPYWKYNDKIKSYANSNSSWSKPLYFGNFCNTHGAYDTSAHHKDTDKTKVWNMMTTENATRFSYSANNSNGVYDHHTSYQGLVSNQLKDNQLYAADGTTKMPYFDEGFDYTKVIKSSFPFRQVEHEAVGDQKAYTEYFFDSTNAKDNVYFDWNGDTPSSVNYGAGTNYGVKDGLKYFMDNTSSGYGIFPFNKNGDGKNLDYGFGIRMDMKFRVPAGGVLPNGEDVKFNFSGDDDLWMFITDKDGNSQLVLDMGGNHKMSTGTVNFRTKKATVDRVHDKDSSCKDIWAVEWSSWGSLVLYAWGNGHEGQFYSCDESADKNGSEYRFRADAVGSKGTKLKDMSNFLVAKNTEMKDGEKTGDLSISDFQGKKFWTDNPSGKIDGPIKHTEKSVTTSFDFAATDAEGNYNDYTMTVFYMERGMLESNCQMSFTMIPLGNDYIVEEEIKDTNVNPGLRDDVKAVTKFDFVPKENDSEFNKLTYTVIDKDGNETRVSGANSKKFSLGSGDAAHFTNFFNTGNNVQVTQYNAEDSVLKYDSHWVYKSDIHGEDQPETSGGTDLLGESGAGTGDRKLIDPKSNQNYDYAQLHAKYVNVPKVSNIAVTKKAVDFTGRQLVQGDLYENDEFEAQVLINLKGTDNDDDFKAYDLRYDTALKDNYTDEQLNALPTAAGGTVTIKNGQTIYFPGVPEGATFKVVETGVDATHFDKDSITVSPETGTIGETANVLITNPRIPPEGEVSLSIEKSFMVKSYVWGSNPELEEVKMNAGEFEFTLKGDGIEDQIKSNDADGNVVFDTLKFTTKRDKADGKKILFISPDDAIKGKEFSFTVKETKGTNPAIEYDTTEYPVKVFVQYDAENNELATDITEGAELVVINELSTGSVKFTKKVVDKDNNPVSDNNDEFSAVVTVSYDGGRTFVSAPYYYVDEMGDYHQLGTEDGKTFTWDGIKNGSTMTIKNLPFGTKVTVAEKDATGYLIADPITLTVGQQNGETYNLNPTAELINKEKPANSTVITVNKTFTDAAKKAGLDTASTENTNKFIFQLAPQGDDTPIPDNEELEVTLTNGASSVSFDTITFNPTTTDYSTAKTYTYKVTEQKAVEGNDASIIYDETEFTVDVTVVEDSQTHELKVTQKVNGVDVKDGGKVSFENGYETGKVSVKKSLVDFDNTTMSQFADETFKMIATITYPNGSVETKSGDDAISVKADGTAVTVIDGAPIGTKVSLFEEDSKGLTSDATRDNPKTAEITVNEKAVTITVENKRDVPEDTETVIEAQKVFNGATLAEGEFEFSLTGDGNDGNNVSLTAKNGADGKVKFEAIKFMFATPVADMISDGTGDGTTGGNTSVVNAIVPLNKADFTPGAESSKDYFFTLKEIPSNRNDVDFDTTEYIVKVTVTVNDTLSKLEVSAPEVVNKDKDGKNLTFTNVKRGKAIVKKIVRQMVDGQEVPFATDTKFDITVTIKEPGKNAVTDNISLGANEEKVYDNLPVGTEVSVVETEKHGFEASYEPASDKVKLNAADNTITDAKVTVKNMRPAPGQTVAPLSVTKNLKGDDLTDDQFQFIAKGKGYDSENGVKATNKGATATFPSITFQYTEGNEADDTANHIVYVREGDFDATGKATFTYTINEDSTYKHDANTTYDGEAVTATVTLTKSGTDTVKLDNSVTYTREGTFTNVKLADVKVTKVVKRTDDQGNVIDIKEGDADYSKLAATEFGVKTYVKYPGKDYQNLPLETSKGQMTEVEPGVYGFTIKHKEEVSISGLPVGTKVKFQEVNDSNYTIDTQELTIGKDSSANVATLTNILQPAGKGIATVTKAFTPNATLAGLPDTNNNTYNFNLSYTGNVPGFSYNKDVSINGEGGWSATFPAITFPADLDYSGNGIDFAFLMTETAATTSDSNIVVDTDTFTLTYNVKQGDSGLTVTGPVIKKNGTEDAETATFYNGYRLGDVKVVKAFEDYDESAIDDSVVANVEFPVTITATYPNGDTESFNGTIGLNKEFEKKDLPRNTKVTVTETDTKGMTLKSILPAEVTIGETAQVVTVTNKRTKLVDTELVIGARKYLEGSPIDENDAFKFTLTGEYKGQTINFEANNAGDVLENNGQAVTFAPVKFTLDESKKADGTIYLAKGDFDANGRVKLQFTVTEVPDNRDNIKFDSKLSRTVNVEVSRTETADSVTLAAGVTDAQAPEFTNTKLGKVGFTKTVIDYDGNAYTPDIDFLFEVSYKKDGQDVKQNVTINVGDDKTDNDSFISEFLPVGTDVTIKETNSKNFKVNTESKTLTVADQTTPVTFTFINTHPDATGTAIQPTAVKFLEGATLKEGEFTFTLTGKLFGTEINQEKKNAADGTIKFDTIKFSLEKDEPGAIKLTKSMFANSKVLPIELKVTEVPDNRADIEYPIVLEQTITGSIELFEDGADAHIDAVIDAEPHEFTNIQLGRAGFTKEAKDINGASFKPDTDFTFKAEYLDGETWKVLDEAIKINLGDSDTTNDSYVTKYLPVGTTVKFTETDTNGFENNDKVKTVDVALENEGKYATVSFTNNRPVPGTTKATPYAEKVLNGAQLGDGDFSFYISGEGAAANKEYKNVGKNITFDEITYKYSKDADEKTSGSTVVLHDSDFDENGKAVREYLITEKNTGLNDVIYATNTVKNVVTITKTETASTITLSANIETPGGKTFTNKIRTGSVKVVKKNQSDENVDGVTFKLYKVSSNDLTRTQVLTEGTYVDEKQTNDGIAEFKDLDLYKDKFQSINNPTYQWYCLAETDPTKDYNLNSGLSFFRLPTENVYDLTFEYMNGKVITPTSGGTGMGMFTTVGCGLLGFGGLAFAAYMLFVRKSNKKRAHYRAK